MNLKEFFAALRQSPLEISMDQIAAASILLVCFLYSVTIAFRVAATAWRNIEIVCAVIAVVVIIVIFDANCGRTRDGHPAGSIDAVD